MTWLSRLLPQNPNQHLASRNNRSRRALRRRATTLETLEGRTLLSNVTTEVTPIPGGGGALLLTITTDSHNDTFTVTEGAGGIITVSGNTKTQINSLPIGQAFTTDQAMTDIDVVIPSGPGLGIGTNTNTITLNSTVVGTANIQNVLVSEPGYSATNPAPTLILNVTGVNNRATLTVQDGTTGTYVGGTLTANVSGSTFTALGITQVGCCPASVTLNDDVVPGTVVVAEGTANGDSVVATNDIFGATTISQFTGGLNPNGNTGVNDLVSVQDAPPPVTPPVTPENGILSLGVYQYGSGTNQSIDIGNQNPVEVSLTGFGIIAEQPNTVAVPKTDPGSNDLIEIESISTYGLGINNPHGGPDSIVTLQGNGNDTTTVENAVIYGHVSVTQGNGNDIVNVGADTVGYANNPSPDGNLTITQGTGTDSVTVNNVGAEGNANNTFYGNVTVYQGNGTSVTVNDSAVSGGVTVTQVSGDSVTVNSDTVGGSVSVSQGDATSTALVESDTVGGSITVSQGNGSSDMATVDNDVAAANISVTQGNGNNDFVHIAADSAGTTVLNGPYITDINGLLVVTQGNGSGDLVILDGNGSEGAASNSFNNVVIEQGDGGGPGNLATCSGAPGYDDVVVVEDTNITSDLFIVQNATFTLVDGSTLLATPLPGDPSLEGTGVGSDLVEIGGDPNGVLYPDGTAVTPSQVTVGDQTFIFQGGANNEVDLGGSPAYFGIMFQTGFLDIWTGSGGGGFSVTTNTVVEYGSYFGNNYVIDGGADGNTFVTEGWNSGVTGADNFATSAQMASPVLTWEGPTDITYGTALDNTELDATASVPGSFSYTAAPGTILPAGTEQTLSVTFTPDDTTAYLPVTTTTSINVQLASPVVTWSNPASISYGTALGAAQLDASTTIPGTFVYSPALGTVLPAGTNQTLSVTFTPDDTADYLPVTTTTSINVQLASPVVTWSNPTSISYGTALGAAQLDASTTIPGTFVYSPALGTVLPAGTNQTLSVTFTPTDTADYLPVTTTTSINVQLASPVVTWSNPASISYGTALGAAQLDASTTIPGSFVYSPAPGTVLPAGTNQTLSVTFTPDDTTDYLPVTTTTSINVQLASPVVTWSNPTSISYGTALGAAQLDASTTIPGSFVYSPAPGTVLPAGTNQTLSVTFTPTDTADYLPVTTTTSINVQLASPVVTWSNPASISYGTALGVPSSTPAPPSRAPSSTRRPWAPCSQPAPTRPCRSRSHPPIPPIISPSPPPPRSR